MISFSTSELVDAWIRLQKVAPDSEECAALMPAAITMNLLCLGNPEKCWDTVLEIFYRTQDEWVLENLAAGPIESLIAQHGELILPRVVDLARADERFREMLSGVWQNLMTDEEWSELQAAARKSR